MEYNLSKLAEMKLYLQNLASTEIIKEGWNIEDILIHDLPLIPETLIEIDLHFKSDPNGLVFNHHTSLNSPIEEVFDIILDEQIKNREEYYGYGKLNNPLFESDDYIIKKIEIAKQIILNDGNKTWMDYHIKYTFNNFNNNESFIEFIEENVNKFQDNPGEYNIFKNILLDVVENNNISSDLILDSDLIKNDWEQISTLIPKELKKDLIKNVFEETNKNFNEIPKKQKL